MKRPIWFGLCMALGCALPAAAAVISDLRCENLASPLGIQTAHPRLSWTFAGGGGVQKAYQVLVASSEEKLNAGDADLWDSGRVMSDQTTGVPYQGRPLESRQRCYWKVRAWDAFYQPTVYTRPETWEMGLLTAGDWKAKWIGSTPGSGGRALYFRYAFTIRKPVKQARAYIAATGYHQLRVNGTTAGTGAQPVSESEPASYSIYDIGSALKQGENVIGAIAGNQSSGSPRLLLQVELIHADGSTDRFYTHSGAVGGRIWNMSSGPILSSTATREVYDARLEKPGWDAPGDLPEPNEWIIAEPADCPVGLPVSDVAKPVMERVPVQKMTEPKPGVLVFDVGRTVSGWPELRVHGDAGTAVTLRYAGTLDADGCVNRSQRAESDVYILRGGGEENWHPAFSRGNFRYIQVEGASGKPELAVEASAPIHR